MFCDFIQATIPAPVAAIRDLIMDAGLAHSFRNESRGGFGYTGLINFLDPARDCHISLYHGSANANPSLKFSGVAAVPGFDFIRREFPDHAVSRVDYAQDFSEEGGFRKRCRALRAIGKKNGMYDSGLALVSQNPEKGSTQAIGSRGSGFYGRCYEKHKELLKKGKITPDQFDPHAHRVEVELRPQKAAEKKLFAHLDSASHLGYFAAGREVATKFFGIDAPEVERLKHQTADCDKSWAHFMRQIPNVAREKALADNTRYHGLIEPTNEDLANIAAGLFFDAMMKAWGK